MPTEKDTASVHQLYQLKDQKPGAELKGSVFTLTVLRLLSNELADVERDLRQKISMGPRFFANAPVVLDLDRVRSHKLELDFSALLDLLKGLDLVPVGVRHATPAQQEAAVAAGLAVVKGGGIRDLPDAPEPKDTAGGKTEAPSGRVTACEPSQEPAVAQGASDASVHAKTVYRPVRSGQQVYSKDGDLIVIAAVNAGAEVVADGNIHIYGPLRGRALAGAQGDRQARIFCQSMEAELVAIAGCYQVWDESVPQEIRGHAAQIYLDGEKLRFERMT